MVVIKGVMADSKIIKKESVIMEVYIIWTLAVQIIDSKIVFF
jgi:hypothetical protein